MSGSAETETHAAPRPSDPVNPLHVEALKQIALLGGTLDPVEINSSEFAELIHSSQQTASRRILELLESDLIERDLGVKKQLLRITEDGIEVLRREHAAYGRIFELGRTIHLEGQVVSGVGEGQYYLNQEGYNRQFEEKLGYRPYPGTLNIELSGAEANKLRLVKARPAILIERFQTEERTFGEVYAWHARLDGHPVAAIIPKRSHYTRVVELIAPEHLRSTLGLADGAMVEVVVEVAE